MLAKAVDAKDHYQDDKTNELSKVAAAVAAKLEFEEDQVEALVLATKLRDIGKIGVPRQVLQKQGKLLPEELELLKQHPQMGEQILQEANKVKDLISAVLYHHERWDDKGYPEGLRGEEIPLMARIVGILDAYRAMRSDRPYRKALSIQDAIAELKEVAGSQFDPGLVKIIVEQLQGDAEQRLREAV